MPSEACNASEGILFVKHRPHSYAAWEVSPSAIAPGICARLVVIVQHDPQQDQGRADDALNAHALLQKDGAEHRSGQGIDGAQLGSRSAVVYRWATGWKVKPKQEHTSASGQVTPHSVPF